MRIEIIGHGIYGATAENPVGTIIEVKDEPKGWAGQYRVVGTTDGKDPIINTPPKSAAELLATEADGLHHVTLKNEAKKALGDKVADDARKADVLAVLLDAATDTELKTYLGLKKVEVKDETRAADRTGQGRQH